MLSIESKSFYSSLVEILQLENEEFLHNFALQNINLFLDVVSIKSRDKLPHRSSSRQQSSYSSENFKFIKNKLEQVVLKKKKGEELTKDYIYTVLKLYDKLNIEVIECVRLIEYVKQTENPVQIEMFYNSTLTQSAERINGKKTNTLFEYCVKSYYNSRDYIISGLLRILVHFNFASYNMQQKYVRGFFTVLFQKEFIKSIINYITYIRVNFFEFPKKKYLLFEMEKLTKILFFVCYSQTVRHKDVQFIFHLMYNITKWIESVSSRLHSKLQQSQVIEIERQMLNMVFITTLTFFTCINPSKEKFDHRNTKYVKSTSKFIDSLPFIKLMVKIIGKVKNTFVKKEEYSFSNGVYGFIAVSWSIFLNKKYQIENEKFEKSSVPSSTAVLSNPLMYDPQAAEKNRPHIKWKNEANKYFDMGIENNFLKFLIHFLVNSSLFDDCTSVFNKGVRGKNVEVNFFMDVLSNFVCQLFDEIPQDRLDEENHCMYKLLKAEEDYIRKTVISSINYPQITFEEKKKEFIKPVVYFEEIMNFLYHFYKKEPKFGRKIFTNKGLNDFVFKRSIQFISDSSKILKHLHQSFDFYLRFLSVLCKDKSNGDFIHKFFLSKEFQLFSWNKFFNMITHLYENKTWNVSKENKIISILKLITTLTLNCPVSRAFFFCHKEFNIIESLFKITSEKNTSPRLMGEIFKTLSSLVEIHKDLQYNTGPRIWNNLESLNLIYNYKFVYQLRHVEQNLGEYPETTGFLKLLQKLIKNGIPINFEKKYLFYPYYYVIEREIFGKIHEFKFKDMKYKWKILSLCLKIFINLIENYEPNTVDFFQKKEEFSLEIDFKVPANRNIFYRKRKQQEKNLRSCSFEIFKNMLTESEFLFHLFRILFEEQDIIVSKMEENAEKSLKKKEKTILLALKLIFIVLSKQESFRFHALKEQRNFPIHFISLDKIFSEDRIFLLFNYLKLDPYCKNKRIVLYVFKVFKEISKNNNQILNIFVSKERQYLLMKHFLNHLQPLGGSYGVFFEIKIVILEILKLNIHNGVSKNQSLSLYLCGLLDDEYYYSNRENNCLNTILKLSTRITNVYGYFARRKINAKKRGKGGKIIGDETEIEILKNREEFIVKSYELILRLCQDVRVRDIVFVILEREDFINKLFRTLIHENIEYFLLSGTLKSELDAENLAVSSQIFFLNQTSCILRIVALKIYHDSSQSKVISSSSHLNDLISYLFFPKPGTKPNKTTVSISPAYEQNKTKIISFLEEIHSFGGIKIPKPLLSISLPKLIQEIERNCMFTNSKGVKQYNIKKLYVFLISFTKTNKNLKSYLSQESGRKITQDCLYFNTYNNFIYSLGQYYSSITDLILICLSKYYYFKNKILYDLLDSLFGIIEKLRFPVVEIYIVRLIFKIFVKLREQYFSNIPAEEMDINPKKVIQKEFIPKNECFVLLKKLVSTITRCTQKSRIYLYLTLINFFQYTSNFVKPNEILEYIPRYCVKFICEDCLNEKKNWKIISINTLNFILNFDVTSEWLFYIQRNGFFEKILDFDFFLKKFDGDNSEINSIVNLIIRIYLKNSENFVLTQKILRIMEEKFFNNLNVLFRNIKSNVVIRENFCQFFASILKLINCICSCFKKNFIVNKKITLIMEKFKEFFIFIFNNKEYSQQYLELINLIYLLFYHMSFNQKNDELITLYEKLLFTSFEWFLLACSRIDEERTKRLFSEQNELKKQDNMEENLLRRMIEKNFSSFCRNRMYYYNQYGNVVSPKNEEKRITFSHVLVRPQVMEKTSFQQQQKQSIHLLFSFLEFSVRYYNYFQQKSKMKLEELSRSITKRQLVFLEYILENTLYVIWVHLNFYLKGISSSSAMFANQTLPNFYKEDFMKKNIITQQEKKLLVNNTTGLLKSLNVIDLLCKKKILNNEFVHMCVQKIFNLIK